MNCRFRPTGPPPFRSSSNNSSSECIAFSSIVSPLSPQFFPKKQKKSRLHRIPPRKLLDYACPRRCHPHCIPTVSPLHPHCIPTAPLSNVTSTLLSDIYGTYALRIKYCTVPYRTVFYILMRVYRTVLYRTVPYGLISQYGTSIKLNCTVRYFKSTANVESTVRQVIKYLLPRKFSV
jgi:hypothetical protein